MKKISISNYMPLENYAIQESSRKKIVLVIILSWTIIIILSLFWSFYLLKDTVKKQAYSQAKAAIQKDLAYRKLVSESGGLYVPLEKGIPQNPYLSHIAHRDIKTDEGQQLTLINSSYFVRLVHDIEKEAGNETLKSNVSSIHPLRSENLPNSWEKKALKLLEKGAKEVSEICHEPDGDYFIMMKPRYTRTSCFACHTDGFFKLGDVMGGLSVKVPMFPLEKERNEQMLIYTSGHLVIWIAGLLLIYGGNILVKRKESDLFYTRYYDALTGLPNRRYLQEILGGYIAKAQQESQHGALLLFDIDRFKNINDSLGHATGDKLLTSIASNISLETNKGQFIARYGNDEFVIILPDLGLDPDIAFARSHSVAVRIQDNIAKTYQIQNNELHITTSIGIAVFPQQGDNCAELLKHADTALHESKSTGCNHISTFDHKLQIKAEERLLLEKELRIAIQNKQLSLYYQPQLGKENKIIGFEALARWLHPKLGMIPPEKFISVAEESGLIYSLGEWGLLTACQQIKKCLQLGVLKEYMIIAVNISALEFHRQEFVSQVKEIITNVDIPAHYLKIELTESAVIDDIHATILKMKELKEIGIRFSLDDFGTGYASLSYLRQLPIQQIKIDKFFVQNMLNNLYDQAIIKAVTDMAEIMCIDVIAEGIEEQEQLDLLHELGCYHYQGYFYSPAIAEDKMINLLGS